MGKVNLQYLTDSEGNKTAVMIPFEDWAKVEKQFLEMIEYTSMYSDLKEASLEVSQMVKENKKGQSLKEFLDEC